MAEKKQDLKEDMCTAGSGAVAGIGVGPNGEPGVNKKNKLAVVMADVLTRKKMVK